MNKKIHTLDDLKDKPKQSTPSIDLGLIAGITIVVLFMITKYI
jgi:hypothetical protein